MKFEQICYGRLGAQEAGAGYQTIGRSPGVDPSAESVFAQLVSSFDALPGSQGSQELVVQQSGYVFLVQITDMTDGGEGQARRVSFSSGVMLLGEEYREYLRDYRRAVAYSPKVFLRRIPEGAAPRRPVSLEPLRELPVDEALAASVRDLAAVREKFGMTEEVYGRLIRGVYSCLLNAAVDTIYVGVPAELVDRTAAHQLMACVFAAMPAVLRAQLSYCAGKSATAANIVLESPNTARGERYWIDLTTGEAHIPPLRRECDFLDQIIALSGTAAGDAILEEMENALADSDALAPSNTGFRREISELNENMGYLLLGAFLAGGGEVELSGEELARTINVLVTMPLRKRERMDAVLAQLMQRTIDAGCVVNSNVLKNLQDRCRETKDEDLLQGFEYMAAMRSPEDLNRLVRAFAAKAPAEREVGILARLLRKQPQAVQLWRPEDWDAFGRYALRACAAQTGAYALLAECFKELLGSLEAPERLKLVSRLAADDTVSLETRKRFVRAFFVWARETKNRLPEELEDRCDRSCAPELLKNRPVTGFEADYLAYLRDIRFARTNERRIPAMKRADGNNKDLMQAFFAWMQADDGSDQENWRELEDRFYTECFFKRCPCPSDAAWYQKLREKRSLPETARYITKLLLDSVELNLKGKDLEQSVQVLEQFFGVVENDPDLCREARDRFWSGHTLSDLELDGLAQYKKIGEADSGLYKQCVEYCEAYQELQSGKVPEDYLKLCDLVVSRDLVPETAARARLLEKLQAQLRNIPLEENADLALLRYYSVTKEFKLGGLLAPSQTSHLDLQKFFQDVHREKSRLPRDWGKDAWLLRQEPDANAYFKQQVKNHTAGEEKHQKKTRSEDSGEPQRDGLGGDQEGFGEEGTCAVVYGGYSDSGEMRENAPIYKTPERDEQINAEKREQHKIRKRHDRSRHCLHILLFAELVVLLAVGIIGMLFPAAPFCVVGIAAAFLCTVLFLRDARYRSQPEWYILPPSVVLVISSVADFFAAGIITCGVTLIGYLIVAFAVAVKKYNDRP